MKSSKLTIDGLPIDESILLKIYDIVRIVNPIKKQCNAGDNQCFTIWGKTSTCENCISMRAVQDKKVVMKLEYNDNKLFMITAVPMDNEQQDSQVIELIRDVTHENLLELKELTSEHEIIAKINQMNREIITDPLTQLYNRRFMDERFPYEYVRSYTSKTAMGVIMADIDFFKNVNDTYGHPIGDQLLVAFSRLLKGLIRDSQDWIVRYGGEEFLIFMSHTSQEILIKKASQMREIIEKHVFTFGETQLRITSSFGAYCLIPEDANDFSIIQKLIHNADQALYHSKRNGRNKVTYYDEHLLTTQC